MPFLRTAPYYCCRVFTRYVFAVSYHGEKLLGFSYQGPTGENCLVYNPDKTIQADLRGVESVEGRLRRALDLLVGKDNYQNIQVSSRTGKIYILCLRLSLLYELHSLMVFPLMVFICEDRGVHAWRNTLQVDIRPRSKQHRNKNDANNDTTVDDQISSPSSLSNSKRQWKPKNLLHGLNFYLSRIPSYPTLSSDTDNKANASKANFYNHLFNNNITVLSSIVAPDTMITNQNYDPSLPDNESNPKSLPWDVRFSATQRTYAYRILHSYHNHESNPAASYYHSQPFEHDRVWRIHDDKGSVGELNIDAMNCAAKFLLGTHDFTSFRGKGCQRSSPVTTLDDVVVHKERYHGIVSGFMLANTESGNSDSLPIPETFHLITIIIKGKSFLYHQVRNIVACLVEVGQGRLTPSDVQKILEKKDRGAAPGMAPAQGLFLVDVKHGDFQF